MSLTNTTFTPYQVRLWMCVLKGIFDAHFWSTIPKTTCIAFSAYTQARPGGSTKGIQITCTLTARLVRINYKQNNALRHSRRFIFFNVINSQNFVNSFAIYPLIPHAKPLQTKRIINFPRNTRPYLILLQVGGASIYGAIRSWNFIQKVWHTQLKERKVTSLNTHTGIRLNSFL